MSRKKSAHDLSPPSPQAKRKLWEKSQSLHTRNTFVFVAVVGVILVGIAALVLALWALLRIPAHPICVDPKIMTNDNAKLHIRVLSSVKTPGAVNKCLTVVPGAPGINGKVVNAELTLKQCDLDDVNQAWTVNGMTVQGDVLNAHLDGVETNLFSLTNAAGHREKGATSSWHLVSPCAMRSMDFVCVDTTKPCVARLNNNGAFNQFAPCLVNPKTATTAAAVLTTSNNSNSNGTHSIDTIGPSIPFSPPTSANRPLDRPPVTAATLHNPQPFFLLNKRTRDNWCGFQVQDHNANALQHFQGLQYDTSLERVTWGPSSDLVLGFVSVDAES